LAIGSLAYWLIGYWLIGSLAIGYWLIGSLAHWLIGSLAHWLIGSLAHWLIGYWLIGSLAINKGALSSPYRLLVPSRYAMRAVFRVLACASRARTLNTARIGTALVPRAPNSLGAREKDNRLFSMQSVIFSLSLLVNNRT
jgi:hypothetical protein